MIWILEQPAAHIQRPWFRMNNSQRLFSLPFSTLEAVRGHILSPKHRDPRYGAVLFENRNIEHAIVLRPKRNFAKGDRHRFVGCTRATGTWNRNHYHRRVTRALMNLRDPDERCLIL